MILGVHVSAGARVWEAFEHAQELGCNTMQFFARSPQRWRQKKLEPEDIEEFRRRKEESHIKPVFVHISYLINLASPEAKLYRSSIKAYIEDIKEAYQLGVDYIVTHMGSHKETSEAAGLKRLIRALNKIAKDTADTPVSILLENTAGSGSWLGYKFSHQRKVFDGLENIERFGICVDTAHAYLAGYDIATKEGLEAMVDEIENTVGTASIRLIHLNDARDKLGSHHDRHQHIGKGNIGMEGMRRIINHPKLKNVPFMLETPKDSDSADKLNLEVVRSLRVE